MDPYKELGLNGSASAEEVKKAYKKLCGKYHPDREGGDEAKFKKINEAYQRITDPLKFRHEHRQKNSWTQNDNTVDRETLEEMLRKAREKMKFSDNFRSQYDTNYSGPFSGFYDRPQFSADIKISLEDAFKGGIHNIKFNNGKHQGICSVNIKPGTVEGTKLIASLNLYDTQLQKAEITVKINPHKVFQLDENDLRVRVSGPMIDFYTGAMLSIPDIAGGTLQVKLPPNSKNNTVLRLKDKGFNHNNIRGNLYVTVEAELPKLTEQQVEKLKIVLEEKE